MEYRALRRVEGIDEVSGLLRIRARDRRTGTRLLGITLLLFGAVLASAEVWHDDVCKACVPNETLTLIGGAGLLAGIPLVLVGIVSDGAEEDTPSPGMPNSIREGMQ